MDENVEIDYDSIIMETSNAWLFKMGKEENWIPKSIGSLNDDPKIKTFMVSEWLAKKNSWI